MLHIQEVKDSDVGSETAILTGNSLVFFYVRFVVGSTLGRVFRACSLDVQDLISLFSHSSSVRLEFTL